VVGTYPENTVGAFAEARRLGADGVELDVRTCADGALVVHHGPVVPGLGPLAELAAADLPSAVPLLDAALAACQGMTVNVEIKNEPGEPGFDPTDAIGRRVARALAESGWTDRVMVSSFRSETVDAVRLADPDLAVGWLVFAHDATTALERAIERGYQALHPFVVQVRPALVDRAHAAGLALNVWTVNADADLVAMAALGVDAVITDRVEAALTLCRPGA